jgi:hypothetical protein
MDFGLGRRKKFAAAAGPINKKAKTSIVVTELGGMRATECVLLERATSSQMSVMRHHPAFI